MVESRERGEASTSSVYDVLITEVHEDSREWWKGVIEEGRERKRNFKRAEKETQEGKSDVCRSVPPLSLTLSSFSFFTLSSLLEELPLKGRFGSRI